MLNSRRRWAKKKKEWSPAGEASQATVHLYWGQTWLTWGCRYSSKWITKTFTSKEGRRWKVVEVQTLQVEDPADTATTEHEKSIEPLTVDSIDSEQTLRCFLPNQPARNQWNFQEKMERHFSVETKFHFESSDPFTFLPKFDHCLAK